MNAARMGDYVQSICPNIPSGPFLSGSPNTFTEGRPQIRVGDPAVPGIALTGSTRCYVNGRPAVRIIDQVSCGRITGPGAIRTYIG